MILPSRSTEALTAWISIDTWHTGHPYDRRRLYDFIAALIGDEFINESLIRDAIRDQVNLWHPGFDPETRERVIERSIQAAVDIYEFSRHRMDR